MVIPRKGDVLFSDFFEILAEEITMKKLRSTNIRIMPSLSKLGLRRLRQFDGAGCNAQVSEKERRRQVIGHTGAVADGQ